jgi:hypothetical protein
LWFDPRMDNAPSRCLVVYTGVAMTRDTISPLSLGGRVVNRVYPLAKDSPLDSNGFYGETCGIAFHTS